MGNQTTPKAPIAPVIADTGCCGHIRTTCRGYQAFDREDRLLGVFASPGEAAAAILESTRGGSMTESIRQLTWRRHGTGWRLFVGRRRFGDVVPDSKYAGMWRSVKSDGRLSDVANLSWAKNAVLVAAERELEWEGRQRRAITPSKSQQKAPVFESKSPPMRFCVSGAST